MSTPERRVDGKKAPSLRLPHDEIIDSPKESVAPADDPPSHDADEEAEAVWRRHTLAARQSTRIAA